MVQALTSFVRTLVSGNSPYDRFYYQGRESALSAEAQRGEALFFSERFECYHCHSGINFSTSFRTAKSQFVEGDTFHNTGLYNIGGTGDYPPGNQGLFEATHKPTDIGRFRVPTLRNIELTAPYMHDGSIATLEEVLEHYAAGGRTIASGPYAGVGKDSQHKNPLVRGFTATTEDKAALLAFLRSLTDLEFTRDPRFQDPHQ
jgi:cytochrome c peroxidase